MDEDEPANIPSGTMPPPPQLFDNAELAAAAATPLLAEALNRTTT